MKRVARTLWTVSGLSLSLLVVASNARADLLEDFAQRRPALAAQYEQAYAHVVIRGIETVKDEKKGYSWTRDCTFIRSGNSLRKDAVFAQSNKPGATPGFSAVMAVNPEYSFTAGKPADAGRYALDEYAQADGGEPSKVAKLSCWPIFAVSHLEDTRIDEILSSEDGHAEAATETTIDGERVVQVSVRLGPAEDPARQCVWQLYFLPNSWAFAGSTRTVPGLDDLFEYRVSYVNGDPLRLKGTRKWQGLKSDPSRRLRETTLDVRSIDFRKVPDAEFRLPSIGVEEPVVAPTPKPWWTKLLWMNALLFLLLAIAYAGFAFRQRARARSRSK